MTDEERAQSEKNCPLRLLFAALAGKFDKPDSPLFKALFLWFLRVSVIALLQTHSQN